MAFFHGVKANKRPTSLSTPVVANSGIHFVVGAAPGHTVGGKINDPIMCNSYTEAVEAFGFSDDWEKYPLCEEIYCAFQLYGIAPIVLVNVLDYTDRNFITEEKTQDFTLIDGATTLPYETLDNTVKVYAYEESGDPSSEELTRGEDYDLVYSDTGLELEILDGGKVEEPTAKLSIKFKEVDPGKVTKKEIIGGYDIATKTNKGFELIDTVFPKYGIIADLLLAPGYSSDSEVAAIMTAKSEGINGLFYGKCVCDGGDVVEHYSDMTAWKKKVNITRPQQLLVWPPYAGLGDRIFHYSTQQACLMTQVDTAAAMGDGSPAESASNKSLQIDRMLTKSGKEVLLTNKEANYLNSQGIITALNFIGGYVSWGNQTAAYPANTDVTDYMYCVSRMFGWVANSVILSTWSKVDRKLNRRLIENICDSMNIWLNGLVAEEKLLGGRIEFIEQENTVLDLMAGIAHFHIYMTPPSPAQEINFDLEYDVTYLQTLFE